MYRLLLALSLTACGTPEVPAWDIPPELVADTLEYMELTGARPIPLVIAYASLPEGFNGLCTVLGSSGEVRLAPELRDIGPWQQKSVLFHELTHCLYADPTHSDDPNALMYPEALPVGDEAEAYWEANLARLTLEAVGS
jgi:hypothetical protein